MKLKKDLLILVILLVLALLIHFYSMNPEWAEYQYSAGIYPPFGRFLRLLFGWIPFSIGDILYGLAVLWLLWSIIRSIKALVKRQVTIQNFVCGFNKGLRFLLITYIIFNIFWGINYNRLGIAHQLNLNEEKYSLDDLKNMNSLLVEKVNTAKQSLTEKHVISPSKKMLFEKVRLAYASAETVYPFLHYQNISLKPSMWSWLGNYMGFTGYYNPFTGEAQVNTLVPEFLQPFTTCHEVAHQLGYAKEMEANSVGYLAAVQSGDTVLLYSVYLDLFMYSNRNLFESDSLSAKEFGKQLLPEVKADLQTWRAFNKKYRNPFEPLFRWVYGKYLERNQQPQGILSYDEVTGFLIAYYKKYGRI